MAWTERLSYMNVKRRSFYLGLTFVLIDKINIILFSFILIFLFKYFIFLYQIDGSRHWVPQVAKKQLLLPTDYLLILVNSAVVTLRSCHRSLFGAMLGRPSMLSVQPVSQGGTVMSHDAPSTSGFGSAS